MNNNELLDLIRQYCKEEKFTKTMNALHRTKNDSDPSLIQLFERHFKRNELKEVSFTFKLNCERSNLRKRIAGMGSEKENSSSSRKKIKVEVNPERKVKVDELGLKRENRRMLFDNKEKWVDAKTDRKNFCVKTGTGLNVVIKKKFRKINNFEISKK